MTLKAKSLLWRLLIPARRVAVHCVVALLGLAWCEEGSSFEQSRSRLIRKPSLETVAIDKKQGQGSQADPVCNRQARQQ